MVAAELAERCTIQLAYAIGVSRPLAVYIDTYGTGQVDEDRLSKVLQELVNLSPRGIREHLGLNKPIYARTSAYGHFGRAPEADGGFSWERTDLVDRSAVRLCLSVVLARAKTRRPICGKKSTAADAAVDFAFIRPTCWKPCCPGWRSSRRTRARAWTRQHCSNSRSAMCWVEIGFGSGEHLAAMPRPIPTSA